MESQPAPITSPPRLSRTQALPSFHSPLSPGEIPSCMTHPSPILYAPDNVSEKSVTRHMRGFYCYSIASEVYAIVSTTLFLPIALEQFARDNALIYPEYTTACPGSSKTSNHQISSSELNSNPPHIVCKAKLLGQWINTSAFPLYVSSLTLIVLALVIISISNGADDETIRKFLIIAFATVGSITASLFFFIDSSTTLWPLVGIVSLISNVALGASTVCLNSLLSGISKESACVMNENRTYGKVVSDREYKVLLSRCTSKISSRGVACGFSAGISGLCLCLILVIHRNGDLSSLRWSIGASAVCWGLLTIPAGLWIPPKVSLWRHRPSPFQPIKSSKELFKIVKNFKFMFETFKFLMAWALLSNAYSTMTSTAILYAKAYLKMKSSRLVVIGLITPATGIFGALIFPLIQKHLSYFSGIDSNLRMLKLVVFSTCAIPLYISTSVVFGSSALSTARDMYFVAAFFGMFYGGFQSYSRSVYTELIPGGQEAKWNSLFSLTAKASSFSGPLIVGVMTECTHDMRYGFLLILFLFIVSFIFLQKISMEKGRKFAEEFQSEIQIQTQPVELVILSRKYEKPEYS